MYAGFFMPWDGRSGWTIRYKTRHRFAEYAVCFHTYLRFGRLQSCVRLIPDALVLRSKSDLVNRILPHFDTPESIAYQLLALWFYTGWSAQTCLISDSDKTIK